MSVCLMAYIPNKLVIWKIQYIMQCQCKFYHSKIGCQMSSGHTDLLKQELPDLLRHLPVIRFIYLFNIICFFDFIQ